MISHEYKCIFIHIPKCAGTSIEDALGHHRQYNGREGQDHRTIRMIETPIFNKHLFQSKENAFEILRRVKHTFRREGNPRNRLTVTSDQYASYFKFAIVRNPWSRAYSWYQNVMADELHREGRAIDSQTPFYMFLKLYAGRGALRPQVYWLRSFDGSIHLDYVGRFENLLADFQEVCACLKIPAVELPHKVKGSGDDYRRHYDKDSKELVANIFHDDIEMFGYSFEL